MRTRLLALMVVVSACGRAPDVDADEAARRLAEQQRAELDTKDVVQGLAIARTALEVLGVLPTYTCGPLNDAIGKAIPPVSIPLSCVTVATREGGIDVSFKPGGCQLESHLVEGRLGFDLGVGEDRIEATADLRELVIDGKSLPVTVGLGVCGDEKRVWATVESVRVGDRTFSLDARVGYRAGLPIIGGKSLVLDGTGSLSGDTDVAAEGLEYEIGAPAPKAGSLTVNRADGSGFTVRFTEVLWKLGKAELTINGREPVEVFIVN